MTRPNLTWDQKSGNGVWFGVLYGPYYLEVYKDTGDYTYEGPWYWMVSAVGPGGNGTVWKGKAPHIKRAFQAAEECLHRELAKK